MEIKKGLFITFEGQDGCGKSTIINEVFKKLNAIYPKKFSLLANLVGQIILLVKK